MTALGERKGLKQNKSAFHPVSSFALAAEDNSKRKRRERKKCELRGEQSVVRWREKGEEKRREEKSIQV